MELLGGVNKRTLDSMVKQARQAHAEANEEEAEVGRSVSPARSPGQRS